MEKNETESGLPIVSKKLLEGLLSEEDKDMIITTGFEKLKKENKPLFEVVEGYAVNSNDPEKVYLCAFMIYYALDKQAFANKMEKQI